MKTKKKMTTGELLARQLKGDKSISDKDIQKSTEDFFKKNLPSNCNFSIKVESKK